MKRVAALAAFMLALSMPASAKVLVLYDKVDPTAMAPIQVAATAQQDRLLAGMIDVLNATGADYKMVPVSAVKTEWARTGTMVYGWNPVSATGSASESFGAVIWLNDFGKGKAGLGAGNPPPWGRLDSRATCYACSLTFNARYPTVPQLVAMGALVGTTDYPGSSTFNKGTIGTYKCIAPWSAGVSGATASYLSVRGMDALPFMASAHKPYSGTTGNSLSTDSSAAAVVYSRGPGNLNAEYTSGWPHPGSAWIDSLGAPVSTHDVLIADRITVGKTITFANVMGGSPCADSAADVNGVASPIGCEFDETTALLALAHLDSLSGGAVWGTSKKLPIRAAVTIDGAFSRNGRRFMGGILASDSTAFIATLDSLNTLGIPITVAANVDSIASYPSELSWWSGHLQNIRWTPQALTGTGTGSGAIDTTICGAWSSTHPVDVFGRYRTRTYYTPIAGDSSITQGLILCRSILAGYVGSSKLSGLCTAPLDDYTPKFFVNAPRTDSLIYAIRTAGFSCLRSDVWSADADFGRFGGNKLLVRGGFTPQGQYRDVLGSGTLNVLGQTGQLIGGSQYLGQPFLTVTGVGDSTTNPVTMTAGDYGANYPLPWIATQWCWHGLFHDRWNDVDDVPRLNSFSAYDGISFPRELHFSDYRHASILKFHCSDLSGDPAGWPKRPGWWVIKSMANGFKSINALAGRTVITFDWPENITP